MLLVLLGFNGFGFRIWMRYSEDFLFRVRARWIGIASLMLVIRTCGVNGVVGDIEKERQGRGV